MMKFNKKIILSALLLSTSVTANLSLTNVEYEEKLYGGWDCKFSISDSGMTMSSESTENYIRNGTINSIGSLTVQLSPELPEIFYTLAGNGTWEVKDGYLISTYTNLKVKNISHPEFDKVMNLQDMFPENVSDSAKIVELNDTTLSIISERDGQQYQCRRKA